MRKCIIILIVVFCSCPVWAKAPEKTGMQQYADSLQRVCIEMNQMNERLRQEKDSIIAQIRSEYETDMNRYHTHINWNIAIIGLLFTGVLAGAGFLANKDVALKLTKTRKRIIGLNKDLKDYKSFLTQLNDALDKQIEDNAKLIKQLNDIKEHVDTAEETINTIKTQIDISAKAAKKSEEKASASALFAQAYYEKDNDKKIELYSQCIDKDPQLAKAYFNRGNAYDDKGDYDQAIKDYDKAIELNPQDADAYINRGGTYSKKGDYDQAINDYDKAIKLNPQLAEAYNNRGVAYDSKGDKGQAIKDYNKAIELNPQDAEAYYNRGVAYRYKGDYDQAINDFDKAIELNPKDADAYNQLCYAYLGKKDFPAALDAVNKAIALAPSDPNYLDSRADVLMAWCKYKKEHPEEYPEIDGKEKIRNALSDVYKAFTMNPYEELKKMLEDKCAECKQLLVE